MSGFTSEQISETVERMVVGGFSGAVQVDVAGVTVHASAHGLADRAHSIPNHVSTRFAGASALKTCTALTILHLVEQGTVALDTRVVSVVDRAVSFMSEEVTVEHLLAHRSGIGDYCQEVDVARSEMTASTATLAQCTLDRPALILEVMDGVPPRAEAGIEFRYNNAGYALLALLAERVTGTSLSDLLELHVFGPAGMSNSAVLSYDELDGDVAIGYRERLGLRTNVHAVPNRGLGDGGLFTTVADMKRLWDALWAGAVVEPATLALMTTPHGRTERGTPYGLGFWLDATTDAVTVEGYDIGISFRSMHRPSTSVTWTVVSNWTDGAWPLADELELSTNAGAQH